MCTECSTCVLCAGHVYYVQCLCSDSKNPWASLLVRQGVQSRVEFIPVLRNHVHVSVTGINLVAAYNIGGDARLSWTSTQGHSYIASNLHCVHVQDIVFTLRCIL